MSERVNLMSVEFRNFVQKAARQRLDARHGFVLGILTRFLRLALFSFYFQWAASHELVADVPIIVTQPAHQTLNSGANVKLTVRVNAASTAVTYEWWNEFGPLFPPQTNATLSLKTVEIFDSGSYRALVKNASGSVTSDVAILTVNPSSASLGENFVFGGRAAGASLDLGGNVAVDAAGNTYVVGGFSGRISVGSTALTSSGSTDAFVAKYNRSGSVIWARKAGGVGDDFGSGVAIDRHGNVHITGHFSMSATFGNLAITSSGDSDVFVASYDRHGTLLWVRKAGGSSRDRARRITTDANGSSYLIGTFSGTGAFDATGLTSSGGEDAFVAKFSSAGILLWAKNVGGSGQDLGDSIAIDPSGNPLISGRFKGTMNLGGTSLASGPAGSAFLAKLNRAGNITWARQADGVRTDVPTTCAVDVEGSHYLSGAFSSTATFGSISLTSRLGSDLFAARYSAAGVVQWAERVGGRAGQGTSIGLNSSHANVAGSLVTGTAAFDATAAETDLFVAKRNNTGGIVWGRQSGNSYAEFPLGVVVDGGGIRYLTGFFDGHVMDTNLTEFSMLFVPLAEGVSPSPPIITTEPQSQTILVGETASFRVVASGPGPLSYQWRWNGTNITGATAATHTIAGAQRPNTGRYSVVVRSPETAAVSREALLTVTSPTSDTTIPAVAISAPKANARVTDASVTFHGTAKDNIAVVRVESQLGDGPFETASGTTDWSDSFTLQPGRNTVRVRSIDSSGNESALVERNVIYVVNTPLIVELDGGGSVNPDLNGHLLEIGKSYSLTAEATPGNIFSHWNGDISSGATQLTFVMRPGLNLRANFVPNPFFNASGAYHGLFYETDAVRHDSSGFVTLKLTDEGNFTGTIQSAGRRLPLSGRFDTEGLATNSVRRAKTDALEVELALDLSKGVLLTGRVTDGNWSAELLCERAPFNAKINPAPLAGRYTLVLPGNMNGGVGPGGDGFGTVTVDGNGSLSFSAMLGDATKATQRVSLPASGYWPLYAPLYSGKGSLLGWVGFTNRPADDFHGWTSWINPGSARSKLYAGGFTNEAQLAGSIYTPPPSKTNQVLNFTNGLVVLGGGNLSATFTNRIIISSNNRVINLASNQLTLTLAASSGRFSGKVTDPATGKAIPIKGAVLQKRNSGSGFFSGTNTTGKVSVGAQTN